MVQARKRFGQNFLHDEQVLSRIATAVNARPGDRLLEIGPGQGALTAKLLASGCEMLVVEIDRDLVFHLGLRFPELAVVSEDILKVDLDTLALAPPIRVVGNLPYNISTPLLFRLFGKLDRIQDMYFMLQLEVVERLAAEASTKHYGRLSVMAQYHCQAELLFEVSPEAFVPRPKVTSAIVRLTPLAPNQRPGIANNYETFSNLVNQAFSMRRKTLRNALKGFVTTEVIESLDIDPGLRPENLTVSDYVQLANQAGGPAQ